MTLSPGARFPALDGSGMPAETLALFLSIAMPAHFYENWILGTASEVEVSSRSFLLSEAPEVLEYFPEVAFTRGDSAPAAQI